jgi:mannosyltransferase OCH1-like enzyme
MMYVMALVALLATLNVIMVQRKSVLSNNIIPPVSFEAMTSATARTVNADTDPCLAGFVYMHDRVLSKDITHNDRAIPRIIHFLLQSRCIPEELARNIHQWNALADHSIIYHDQRDIDKYMTANRKDFASISTAYNCAPDSRAQMDIARFLILWDFGGIAIDIDNVPGPAFLNGTIISNTDECVFEVDETWTANPRFLASAPQHSALYVAITKFVLGIFVVKQRCHDPESTCNYAPLQSSLYMGFIADFHDGRDQGNVKTHRFKKKGYLKSNIVQINTNRTEGGLFTHLILSNSTKDEMKLNVFLSADQDQCEAMNVLNNDSFQVDIKSLIEIAGIAGTHAEGETTTSNGAQQNVTCPDGLNLINSKYDPRSIVKGRKIPKIVHMTSKSHCFTDNFAININKWRFDGHSFFMRDDAAVDRLFDRDWPESLSCILTGAGKADLWRYLLLWEYGGIYTDIDNAPGDLFLNGTVISDEMDSFFEQERGGFPSQYFFAGRFDIDTNHHGIPTILWYSNFSTTPHTMDRFAQNFIFILFTASPHHPVMYFMVHAAITRLLDTPSIKHQYVPFVTGPGATKMAVMTAIGGSGYFSKGEYVGVNNRNVTIVGSRREAQKGRYVHRDSISKKAEELSQMNMTQYEEARDDIQGKSHSCFLEIYKKSKISQLVVY